MKPAIPSDPPKWARRLLRLLIPFHAAMAEDDYAEIHAHMSVEMGRRRADAWYRRQVWRAVPVFISEFIHWRMHMLFSYFKLALRHLFANKLYFILNVSGLAMGIALFLVSAMELDVNYRFDEFHNHAERMYGLVAVRPSGSGDEAHYARTPAPLLPALREDFPEIEAATQFRQPGRVLVSSGDRMFHEGNIFYTDDEFLTVFTFPMLAGDPATALSGPNQVVLTESAAEKYFGREDPMGRTLSLDRKQEIVVTGVLKEPTRNSSIRFGMLVSLATLGHETLGDWSQFAYNTFLRLPEGMDPAVLESRLPAVVSKYFPERPESPRRMYLLPLLDFHLDHTHIYSDLYQDVSMFFYMGLTICCLLLLVVCLNFMSLSAARFLFRGKEVAVRKVIGARRSQIVAQFLAEALVMAGLALPLALAIFTYVKDPMLALFGNYYDMSLWDRPQPLMYALLITLFAGVLSGSYPAWFLSKFRPVDALQRQSLGGRSGSWLRKLLVVGQFAVAVVIIVFGLMVKQQYDYIMDLDRGFVMDDVLIMPVAEEARSELQHLRTVVLRHGDVAGAATTTRLPMWWEPVARVTPEGALPEEALSMHVYPVGYDLPEVLQMNLLQGRFFSRSHDDEESLVVSRLAAEQLGWGQPIGRELVIGETRGRIVGVVDDFKFSALYRTLQPAVLQLAPDKAAAWFLVKLRPGADEGAMTVFLRDSWQGMISTSPFECYSLTREFKNSARGMESMSWLVSGLGAGAALLSCLGLVALATFLINRRAREIGIRKVLGASGQGIVRMFLGRFLRPVLLANLVAAPLAYLACEGYLSGLYAERMTLGPDIFLVALAFTLLVATAAVLTQTMRAARANPVQTLRSE
ncbi:MAG: ABC transporter permease [Acidobacteria bacterium]|nr:ABC transporter permease [Acidobacteriota bacterium]